MAIIRRNDPFELTRSLWQVPSIFNDDWLDFSEQGLSVYETDDDVMVEANVAGVPSDKVDISIEGGTVTIRAEYEESEEKKRKKKVEYRRARQAKYLYTASLPTPVDAERATATIEHGILSLTLPKREEAKPKQIKVSAK